MVGANDAFLDDAFRSALDRLGVAIILAEGGRSIRPINSRAVTLFRKQGIAKDLPASRPSHPLSQMLQEIREDGDSEVMRVLTFPSGERFTVEASRRSEKGKDRWLVLLVRPLSEQRELDAERALAEFHLSGRENAVVRGILRGETSADLQERLGITANTLKTHLRNILTKTNTTNRTQLLSRLFGS